MKKIISLMLTVIMLCMFIPAVYAEGDTGTNGSYTFASAYSPELGVYVAAGRYGAIYVSQNGVDFKRVMNLGSEAIGSKGLKQVSWLEAAHRFVVLSNQTATLIAYSDDGINWSSTSAQCDGASLYLSAVTYAAGKYIGAGYGGHIYTSTDLTAWTKVTTTGLLADDSYIFKGIEYGEVLGKEYIVLYTDAERSATTNTNTMFFADPSDDSWYVNTKVIDTTCGDSTTYPAFIDVYDLKWSEEEACFVGIGSHNSKNCFIFKLGTDGTIARKGGNANLTNYSLSIAVGEDNYLISTSSGGLEYVSKDSSATGNLTRTSVTSGTDNRIYSLSYGKGKFIATTAVVKGETADQTGFVTVDESTMEATLTTTFHKNSNCLTDNEIYTIDADDCIIANASADVTRPVALVGAASGELDAAWTLKADVEGVALSGNEITVASDIAENAIVTVTATHENGRILKKNIEIKMAASGDETVFEFNDGADVITTFSDIDDIAGARYYTADPKADTKLFVAAYSNNELISVNFVSIDSAETRCQLTLPKKPDEIKAFVWTSVHKPVEKEISLAQ